MPASAQSPRLSFHTLLIALPREIVDNILLEWTAQPGLVIDVTYDSQDSTHFVAYACGSDTAAESLPSALREEYWLQRELSWLRDTKAFRSPYEFYMSHYLLSLDPATTLPGFDHVPAMLLSYRAANATTRRPIRQQLPHADSSNHGLEKVFLDFGASQYLALFEVRVPPFDDESEITYIVKAEAQLHGAASLLQHTKHLTLHFGGAYKWHHPWAEVWTWRDARIRPNVCDSGLVVDWILEFAWQGAFLQHIPVIKISGDVQLWVKTKWEDIFVRQKGATGPFAVHTPDLHAITKRGLAGSDGEWLPEDHYPPNCTCEVRCSRLFNGLVAEEGCSAETGWVDLVPEEGSSEETGWDDTK
jgi:hypothetical protein